MTKSIERCFDFSACEHLKISFLAFQAFKSFSELHPYDFKGEKC